jgi:acyl carrier protein
LISIVSELTGYPEEMLGLEMDIEADLGIDSIKRVEILSAMEERMPQLPQVTPDRVGTLKTLGQICDFLSGTDQKTIVLTMLPAFHHHPRINRRSDPAEAIPRQIVDMVSFPKKNGRPFRIEPGRWIGVISDEQRHGEIHGRATGEPANPSTPDIHPRSVDTASPFTGIAGSDDMGADRSGKRFSGCQARRAGTVGRVNSRRRAVCRNHRDGRGLRLHGKCLSSIRNKAPWPVWPRPPPSSGNR